MMPIRLMILALVLLGTVGTARADGGSSEMGRGDFDSSLDAQGHLLTTLQELLIAIDLAVRNQRTLRSLEAVDPVGRMRRLYRELENLRTYAETPQLLRLLVPATLAEDLWLGYVLREANRRAETDLSEAVLQRVLSIVETCREDPFAYLGGDI